MKRLLLFLLFHPLLPASSAAQQHDNTWLSGYEGGSVSPDNDTFGISVLSFPEGSLKISDNQEIALDFYVTALSMSDSLGNLLFYTNGIHVEDVSWHTMSNGNNIHSTISSGQTVSQGVMALAFPGIRGRYALLHIDRGYVGPPFSTIGVLALNYSVIDMAQQNGLGAVVEKRVPLIVDTLQYGKLSAVKHANGRDWWILVAEAWSNRFYRVLFTTDGFQLQGTQTIGDTLLPGVGQAVFSPDGARYIVYDAYELGAPDAVDVYDFDRCSGMLGNHRRFSIGTAAYAGGVSVSPNSRFLYVHTSYGVAQFDLLAPDIEASRIDVAVYDGYESPFPTHFFAGRLAPDGKIYISTSNGTDVLHVIHRPDEPGTACMVEQHGIRLPTYNATSMVNFPNYRLGPLDGSSCDTLGIDNLPVAWWRSQPDTMDMLQVAFHDLSYYGPDTWTWNFGDGSAPDSERHPVHVFPAPGTYSVCLRVGNSFGSDTLCRTVRVGVSAADEPDVTDRIQVFPNPFRRHLSVALSARVPGPVLELFDQTGRPVRAERLVFGITDLNTEALPAGIYFWKVTSDRLAIKSGILVKSVN